MTDPDLEIPPALRRELQALTQAPGELPQAVRQDLQRTARQRLSPTRPARPWAAWAGLLAAAGLIAALGLGPWLRRPGSTTQEERIAAVPADWDRSGHVNVLDAFGLAQALERGETPDAPDLDGDGRVDRADVDLIARLAVRLDR